MLDPTNLHTVGLDDLNQVLRSNKALAAHFRYDPFQDRLVTISLKVGLKKRSKLLVMEFDRSWKCLAQQELYIPGLNYAHVRRTHSLTHTNTHTHTHTHTHTCHASGYNIHKQAIQQDHIEQE